MSAPVPYAHHNLRLELRGWAILAAAALAVAGVFALLLALARTPVVQDYLPWPWMSFFHKGLVTHVMYSFIVWYLLMLGALCQVASVRLSNGRPKGTHLGLLALWIATTGFILLAVPALLDMGEPSLNNYVPVLTDPVYYAALLLLFIGVALAVLRLFINLGELSAADPFSLAVAAAGLIYWIALACFLVAWLELPNAVDDATFNEHVFWGGGHVLQFANTAMLFAGWQYLSEQALKQSPVSPQVMRSALLAMLIFVVPSPLFYLVFPILGQANKEIFTDIFWFGLLLPPLILGLGATQAIWQRRATLPWKNPAFLSLFLSLILFGLGGLAGYFLGPSDTRTPAHYHMVIGGINLVLMGLFVTQILPLMGRTPKPGKALYRLFHLYGWGQLLWSLGMFIAGAQGVPRKTAGSAQGLDSVLKKIAMTMTGSGGVIAVIGGVIFIWIVLKLMLGKEEKTETGS
jgi:cytochrome c oxidase subunit 1